MGNCCEEGSNQRTVGVGGSERVSNFGGGGGSRGDMGSYCTPVGRGVCAGGVAGGVPGISQSVCRLSTILGVGFSLGVTGGVTGGRSTTDCTGGGGKLEEVWMVGLDWGTDGGVTGLEGWAGWAEGGDSKVEGNA